MSTEHQPKWRAIVTVGTLLAVLAWCGVLLISGAELSELVPSLTKFGAVSILVWLSWLAFTKWVWRWRWLTGRWLVTTPYLAGRWVGTYISLFDKIERKMTLEIRQTLLTLECISFGPDSVADIYIARLLSDRDDQGFKLVFFYHAKRKPTKSVPGDEHEGVVVARLIDGPPMRLEGYYLNDRHPTPTKGDIELTWESKHLKKIL